MKCLMRMFSEEDKGVVFYETVISLKQQKHTVIECVPVPWEEFETLPGYFRVSAPFSLAASSYSCSHSNRYWNPRLNGRSTRS